MRETRSSGSVRGASGDGRPYRERKAAIAARSGEGRQSIPAAVILRMRAGCRLWGHGLNIPQPRGTAALPPPAEEEAGGHLHRSQAPTPDIALAAYRHSVIRRGQRGRYAELGSVRLLKDALEACAAKRK